MVSGAVGVGNKKSQGKVEKPLSGWSNEATISEAIGGKLVG